MIPKAILDVQVRLKAYKKKEVVRKVLNDSVKQNSKEIGSINADQLKESRTFDGEPIVNLKTGRSTYGGSRKKPPGPGAPYILKDTGAFHKGLRALPKARTIEFKSVDRKNDLLAKTYSEAIFGLSPEKQEIANRELIIPSMRDIVRQEL